MSSIIHKTHKDRYRIRFCDENFYLRNQDTFLHWKRLFSQLNDVEKLTAWVVGLSCLRRNDWYQGASQRSSALTLKHPLTLKELFEGTPVTLPKKIDPSLDLYTFIASHNIKALPHAALSSLWRVVEGLYPVVITRHIPSPAELLTLQLSGQRIISLNEDTHTWPTALYSGRDFLGFLLHDLLHAEHFFAEPVHRDGQLGVYRYISAVLYDEGLQSLLSSSEKFKDGFEYIISDMNSHCLHMLQTLHSLLFSSLKDDARAAATWERWIAASGFSAAVADALSRVNTSSFTPEHAEVLSSGLTTTADVALTGERVNVVYPHN